MEKVMNNGGKYGKYLMQDIVLTPEKKQEDLDKGYEASGKRRIFWMDGNNMPGCWQLNASWYLPTDQAEKPDDRSAELPMHVHDVDEIVCYAGTDPEHPWDLGGEIEMVIGDERHVLTKSTLIFLPAGLPHSLPCLAKIDRPIFHFSTVLNGEYIAK